ncbi:MAG: 2-succinyl-5-enolpyruvyl-6-hydroxy-3-cyclohexene-1-carboxylic-acid synthase [Leptolyngbyaceae cyanobacterium bins.59]|nr:2-succinyl-5-enolpyruvyl-6-hydroxy-3-cyclohexene-1-carboxylic-acid synthase [Leptolyngbyaceae cyanobacterium bins.59]
MDHIGLDFRNTNALWASILVETLHRLGLRSAVLCPGSRSTPMTIAFVSHPQIEAIPVLDERSASFFALGLARQRHQPVALVCTSGTAGANFYPAVIEARESRVPLLVFTADRPPELRDCNAGQAIDQQKLFGSFPNWYTELALPEPKPELLAYLRQTLIYAWERTLWPAPGPVHLNLPLRDPLAPLPDPTAQDSIAQLQLAHFFDSVHSLTFPTPHLPVPLSTWQSCTHGLILAGPAQPAEPDRYCEAVVRLSKALGWPVLAEGLSPLRNQADRNPFLISTYDLILRNGDLAKHLAPQMVIRLGEMPTSKQVRTWLPQIQPRQWIVTADDRNLDPLHLPSTSLRTSIEQIANQLPDEAAPPTPYLKDWCAAERQVREQLDRTLATLQEPFEGKAAWLLSQHLPAGTPLFIASSMPVRDVEFFWAPNSSRVQPYFNRGANGIDGTLSTALGIAHRQQSSVLLTGDLALLHDTNGFLLRQQFQGHLTILLINNNGGGIFEMLPIAQFEPPFEEFFATPQNICFADLSRTYGIDYEVMETWEQLIDRLNPLPPLGMRLLELQTNRKADARWRHTLFQEISSLWVQNS